MHASLRLLTEVPAVIRRPMQLRAVDDPCGGVRVGVRAGVRVRVRIGIGFGFGFGFGFGLGLGVGAQFGFASV